MTACIDLVGLGEKKSKNLEFFFLRSKIWPILTKFLNFPWYFLVYPDRPRYKINFFGLSRPVEFNGESFRPWTAMVSLQTDDLKLKTGKKPTKNNFFGFFLKFLKCPVAIT